MPTSLSLSKRIELKYFIHSSQYNELLNDLLVFMTFDPYLDKITRSYEVWSLYFDSPNQDAYFEKLDGLNVRQKLRFRTYGPLNKLPENINVEIKARVKFQTIKVRSKIPLQTYNQLLKSRYHWSTLLPLCENGNLKKFYQVARLTNAIPSVLVKYQRRALVGKRDPDIRVTFDWNLQRAIRVGDLFSAPKYMPAILPPRKFVFEIKFRDHMPDWIYFIIKKYRLFNEAISKYAICLQQ
ncbi:MAG: polyphosphate polymerase domain-containing protein [Deltaproteobacteria bacterium]|nr:polyphosphate polymerase domain-containing protein [Deltaproteobacteria bacterium]